MYTVTRQAQWPDGNPMVEVSAGGIDFTNPDALVEKYEGEFEEFASPVEAVRVAIEICRSWRRDGEGKAKVGIGATGGMTMPFDAGSFSEARMWAEKVYEKIEKCPACGSIVEDLKEWWSAGEWFGDDFIPYEDGCKYCSEHCAERNSIVFTGDDDAL